MTIPTEELTPDDLELIEFARTIIDANTDAEYGVHTMGAALRGVDGRMYGGVNLSIRETAGWGHHGWLRADPSRWSTAFC